MEKVITISQKLARNGKLVIIPHKEYEEYLRLKKVFPIIKASLAEKKAIKEGRKEIKEGKYITLKQLKNELGN